MSHNGIISSGFDVHALAEFTKSVGKLDPLHINRGGEATTFEEYCNWKGFLEIIETEEAAEKLLSSRIGIRCPKCAESREWDERRKNLRDVGLKKQYPSQWFCRGCSYVFKLLESCGSLANTRFGFRELMILFWLERKRGLNSFSWDQLNELLSVFRFNRRAVSGMRTRILAVQKSEDFSFVASKAIKEEDLNMPLPEKYHPKPIPGAMKL